MRESILAKWNKLMQQIMSNDEFVIDHYYEGDSSSNIDTILFYLIQIKFMLSMPCKLGMWYVTCIGCL